MPGDAGPDARIVKELARLDKDSPFATPETRDKRPLVRLRHAGRRRENHEGRTGAYLWRARRPEESAIGGAAGGVPSPPATRPVNAPDYAVRHVYALRPLTEDVVTALNAEITLADVVKDVTAAGYPG